MTITVTYDDIKTCHHEKQYIKTCHHQNFFFKKNPGIWTPYGTRLAPKYTSAEGIPEAVYFITC